MKLKDLKDVLTFAAFRPEPDDGGATWTRRFPASRTLLLNVGKNQTSWQCLNRGGRLTDGGVQKGDFKDVASGMAAEWRRLADDGWCNVSINSRYVISIESNLPRKEGIEDVMRANPRAALGTKYERTKRYALINNPEHGAGIVLSCEDEVIRKIEAALAEAGLRAGRICCGTYTLLRRAIEHANNDSSPEGAPGGVRLFVVCCEGSVCLLTQTDNAWSDLRSRTDFYEADVQPVLDMLTPLRRNVDARPSEVILATDHADSPFPGQLAALFPEARLTDLTQPDHLWALIADLR